MSIKQSRWRTWTALFAAYALAMQTLFLALSFGAHAAPLLSDPHVLCLASDQVPDGSPVPADSAHRIDCCVLGGNMLGKLLVPPQALVLAVRQAQAAVPAVTAVEASSLPRLHSPLTARGPPLA